jgi:hypothetical protein
MREEEKAILERFSSIGKELAALRDQLAACQHTFAFGAKKHFLKDFNRAVLEVTVFEYHFQKAIEENGLWTDPDFRAKELRRRRVKRSNRG